MLVLIDESGDTGFKFSKNSSEIFTMCLLIFEDEKEAERCDNAIQKLKKEIYGNKNEEFHFKTNRDKTRIMFLQEIRKFDFYYYGFVLNKKQIQLDGFENKEEFYKTIFNFIFENAKSKIKNATIIIDKTGNDIFKENLKKYIKVQMNSGDKKRVLDVKMQDSCKNNLLQLADYIVSGLHRFYDNSKDRKEKEYIKIISSKEIQAQIYP